jgi:hypothetical protein
VKGNPMFAYLRYASNDVSNKLDRPTLYTQDRTQKQNAMTLGASYNVMPSEKTLMVTAINLNSTTEINDGTETLTGAIANAKYESETTTVNIPVTMAVEHHISNVVTARFGICQDLYQSGTSKATTTTYDALGAETGVTELTTSAETLAGTTVSLGAGINVLKDLTVDAVVRQQVLFSGTYLVSGVPETLVSQISAKYRF